MIDWILDQKGLRLNEPSDNNYNSHPKMSSRLLFGMMLEKASLESSKDSIMCWLKRIRKLMKIKGFSANTRDDEGNTAVHMLVTLLSHITHTEGHQFDEDLDKACRLLFAQLISTPNFCVNLYNKDQETALAIARDRHGKDSWIYKELSCMGGMSNADCEKNRKFKSRSHG